MVHRYLERHLWSMHKFSATEPVGYLFRGCMAGHSPNHHGNQAQLESFCSVRIYSDPFSLEHCQVD